MSLDHFWSVSIPELGNVSVHVNTLLMVFIAMGIQLALAFWAKESLAVLPSRGQLVAEKVYAFCRSITYSTAGSRGDTFLPYVGSIFLFILTCNLMGQLPLKLIPLPHGELLAATGDLNVPAALAICTSLAYFFYGLKANGWNYFKHYLTPVPLLIEGKSKVVAAAIAIAASPMMLMNLAEDFTKPGSLLIRLFANILVGEILHGIAHSITPLGLPALVILLELFVAVIQAYVFAILSSVYIAMMTEDHSDHAHHEEAHATPALAHA